jgi:hypothetical protein
VEIEFDPEDKKIEPHPKLVEALRKNRTAAEAWDRLTPSRRWEIVRYIGSLKQEESIDRNPTFEREGGVCGKMALEMKRGAGFYSKAFETIGSRSNGALMASGRPYLSRT